MHNQLVSLMGSISAAWHLIRKTWNFLLFPTTQRLSNPFPARGSVSFMALRGNGKGKTVWRRSMGRRMAMRDSNPARLLQRGTSARFIRHVVLVAILVGGLSGRSHARTIEIFPGTNVFGPAAQGLVAGDTLIVHQGTYIETNRMSIQVRGTSTAPIVIKGADGEAKPIITRPASASTQNTINVEGSATYLTLRGLEIIGNGGDGVAINGNLSYITLEDLDIHDVDVGIGAHTSMNNITIRRNHIYNTGIGGGTGEGMYLGCHPGNCSISNSLIEGNWIHDSLPGTSQGDGIEVKPASHSNIVRDNVIYNRSYPGIFVYGGGPGNNIVEGNVVWNCAEGIYAVSDAMVRNNIVLGSGTGLSLYGHSQISQMKNVTVENNTLYNNDTAVYVRWGAASTNMNLANNAIYSPGKTAVSSGSGITGTVRSNYVEGNVDVPINNIAFFSGGSAANAFVNPSGNDFWPKPGSPLIGSANATFVPTVDFNNTGRVSPFDVGAYETNGITTNPGWKITPGFKPIGGDMTRPSPPGNVRLQ